MLTKEQKKTLVKELSEKIAQSKTVVLCDYKGITVSEISVLRSELRKSEAKMQVAKKTLTRIALKEANIEMDVEGLEGQVAIAFGGADEVSVPKAIYGFAKKNDKLKILAGVLEGKNLTIEEVVSLAKLPSKQELLAKVVGTINAPISSFVNVLAGNIRNLVQVLKAVSETK